MRRLITSLAMLFILSGQAHAARELVTGLEYQGLDNGSNESVWSVLNGTPTVEESATTPTNGDTQNDRSVEINPASGSSEYMEWDVTDGAERTAHFGFRINTAPASTRVIYENYDSTGTQRQCFLEYNSTDKKLDLFFNTNAKECASSTNDGTTCTLTSECNEVNPGEAVCANATFGRSLALATNTWYEVTVTEDASLTNPGDVQCGLYIDGSLRGNPTRPQGVCSGGSRDTFACSLDADCTGGGTCGTATVATTDVVRFGVTDTVAAAADLNYDDFVIDTTVNTDLRTLRIRDIHPNGTVGLNEWNSHQGCATGSLFDDCVDDTIGTGTPDDGTTFIGNPGSANIREVFALEDITLASGESIASDTGVGMVINTSDFVDLVSGSNANVKVGIRDSSNNESLGTAFDFSDLTDKLYHPIAYMVFTADPLGGVWSEADIDTLRGLFFVDTTAGNPKITDLVAEVEITKPAPIEPSTLSDQNLDGEITVCISGDSRLNDSELYDNLSSQLEQPDNVLDCARGGATSGDMSLNWSTILDGGDTGWLSCLAKKGAVNKKCDYVVIDIGVNDYHRVPNSPKIGVCFDNGGPDDQQPCSILRGIDSKKLTQSQTLRCREGASFGNICTAPADCVGGPTSGLSCTYNNPNINTWCAAGEYQSEFGGTGCPNGLCLQQASTAYVHTAYLKMITDAIDRTGASNVIPILMAPVMTANNGIGCWPVQRDDLVNERSWIIKTAQDKNLPYLDLQAEFYDKCENNSYESCIRDGVHYSTSISGNLNNVTTTIYGNDITANVIEACLEEDATFTNQFCAGKL